MIRAHQPGSAPIDIPETIPNPVVVPKPTRTPTEPTPKEPVRIPEEVPSRSRDTDFTTAVLARPVVQAHAVCSPPILRRPLRDQTPVSLSNSSCG